MICVWQLPCQMRVKLRQDAGACSQRDNSGREVTRMWQLLFGPLPSSKVSSSGEREIHGFCDPWLHWHPAEHPGVSANKKTRKESLKHQQNSYLTLALRTAHLWNLHKKSVGQVPLWFCFMNEETETQRRLPEPSSGHLLTLQAMSYISEKTLDHSLGLEAQVRAALIPFIFYVPAKMPQQGLSLHGQPFVVFLQLFLS